MVCQLIRQILCLTHWIDENYIQCKLLHCCFSLADICLEINPGTADYSGFCTLCQPATKESCAFIYRFKNRILHISLQISAHPNVHRSWSQWLGINLQQPEAANTKYQLLYKIQAHREWLGTCHSIKAKTAWYFPQRQPYKKHPNWWALAHLSIPGTCLCFVSGTELCRDPPCSVLFASPPHWAVPPPQFDTVQPDPTGMQQSSSNTLVKVLSSLCNTCHGWFISCLLHGSDWTGEKGANTLRCHYITIS